MQQQVHFIVAQQQEQDESPALVMLATTIIHHYFRQGLRLFVYCADQQQAEQLDEALFAAPLDVFTPHCLTPWRPRSGCPVELGWMSPGRRYDLLLNLHPQAPSFKVQSRFIIELVPAAPAMREQARTHFRHYQRQGLRPHTHDAAELPQLA